MWFEHYPASPDELVGLSVTLTAAGDNAGVVVADVQAETTRVMQSVDGDLEGLLGQAPQLVLATGADVEAGARFCAGCLLYFAQAIIGYNAGIDALNQQLLAAIESQATLPVVEQKSLLELAGTPDMLHQKSVLDATLDQAADDTSLMLGRGPNEADLAILAAAGALPAQVGPDGTWGTIGEKPHAAAVLDETADPAMAAEFWASLSAVERAALIRDRPDLVGGTNGFPVGARDEANRLLLQGDIDQLTEKEMACTITADERRALDNARATQQALDETEASIDPVTGEPVTAQLMIYEPNAFGGDGRGAISVGDADTADNVAFFVPGITTTLAAMPGNVGNGRNLYGEARRADPVATTAVVVWIGYDAPSGDTQDLVTQTVPEQMADEGGELLAADFAAFETSRGPITPLTTVIGHSYGSTTVSYAAAEDGMRPDNIVLIGSPGAGPADDASDLGLPEEHVFVGSAASDPVTYAGNQGLISRGELGLGYDPAEAEFDAIRIRAEFVDRDPFSQDDHGRYFEAASESLDNMGYIVTGQESLVVEAEPRDDPPIGDATEPEWERVPEQVAP